MAEKCLKVSDWSPEECPKGSNILTRGRYVAGSGTTSRARKWALSNTWKWMIRGDTWADKARDFIGKECMGGEQQGKGTQESCSAVWLEVLGFMVMGLVSGLFLANHYDSRSFLVVHTLLSHDRCQWEEFWEVEGHMASPVDLSQTLPIGGSLLVPCSLPGPPVIK